MKTKSFLFKVIAIILVSFTVTSVYCMKKNTRRSRYTRPILQPKPCLFFVPPAFLPHYLMQPKKIVQNQQKHPAIHPKPIPMTPNQSPQNGNQTTITNQLTHILQMQMLTALYNQSAQNNNHLPSQPVKKAESKSSNTKKTNSKPKKEKKKKKSRKKKKRKRKKESKDAPSAKKQKTQDIKYEPIDYFMGDNYEDEYQLMQEYKKFLDESQLPEEDALDHFLKIKYPPLNQDSSKLESNNHQKRILRINTPEDSDDELFSNPILPEGYCTTNILNM
jgi:hypothetical protein